MSTARFNGGDGFGLPVRPEVVQNDNVVTPELRGKSISGPSDEALRIHRAGSQLKGESTRRANGSDHREISTVIEGNNSSDPHACRRPSTRSSHGDVGPGFVKEHQVFLRDLRHQLPEGDAFDLDIRSEALESADGLFLTEKPNR